MTQISLCIFQLDGFIARNWTSQASKLGSFLDPMADKLLVGALVISLSYCNLFPVWLCAMIIFRDVFLIIAGFVIRYISLPPPVSIITDCNGNQLLPRKNLIKSNSNH